MKKLILTVLMLGLWGTVGADWEDIILVDGVTYIKVCDTIYCNEDPPPVIPKPPQIICGYEQVEYPLCTVFVDKPCTVWVIPTEDVVRIPLWMQYKWQQIEAIVDSALAEM